MSDKIDKETEKAKDIEITDNKNKKEKDIPEKKSSDKDIAETEKKEKSTGARKVFFSYLRIIIIAAAAAIFLMFVVFQNAKVPTGSMKDTINENDRLIGLKLAYVAAEPQRGDVVIFRYPDNENDLFVKRVIGLPGETVSFKNGDVYINGELLEEDYIREPHSTEAVNNHTEYTVPENSYFMLGDNRNNSRDARFWNNTYVTKDKIVAKVLFRYFDGEKNFIGFKGI